MHRHAGAAPFVGDAGGEVGAGGGVGTAGGALQGGGGVEDDGGGRAVAGSVEEGVAEEGRHDGRRGEAGPDDLVGGGEAERGELRLPCGGVGDVGVGLGSAVGGGGLLGLFLPGGQGGALGGGDEVRGRRPIFLDHPAQAAGRQPRVGGVGVAEEVEDLDLAGDAGRVVGGAEAMGGGGRNAARQQQLLGGNNNSRVSGGRGVLL
jgi:hypothetical protein